MSSEQPIMIVDDESHIRTYLRLVCEKRFGRPVVEAGDGSSALDLAAELPPSLVVLDINMPGMNGVEALKQFRRLYPETPVVMLSVCASRAVVKECVKAGASAYLRKDTPIKQIFDVLERFIPHNTPAAISTEVTGE